MTLSRCLLATDNVTYTANPNKWNVKNITFASLIVGALLVVEGAVALFIGSHYFHLPLEQLQTFTVLMLIFTSQFRVYIVRERKYFWSSLPGRELALATAGAVVVFSLLGVYGLIIPCANRLIRCFLSWDIRPCLRLRLIFRNTKRLKSSDCNLSPWLFAQTI